MSVGLGSWTLISLLTSAAWGRWHCLLQLERMMMRQPDELVLLLNLDSPSSSLGLEILYNEDSDDDVLWMRVSIRRVVGCLFIYTLQGGVGHRLVVFAMPRRRRRFILSISMESLDDVDSQGVSLHPEKLQNCFLTLHLMSMSPSKAAFGAVGKLSKLLLFISFIAALPLMSFLSQELLLEVYCSRRFFLFIRSVDVNGCSIGS